MRKAILATMMVGLLLAMTVPAQAYHEGTPGDTGNGDPPNRRPVAVAGPDQRVSESQVILFDAVNSFDPDPDDDEDLIYVWTIEKRPEQVMSSASGKPISVPIPLQTAQECIIEDEMALVMEDWMYALHAPYIPPGTPPRLELVMNLTVYDRDPTTVDKMWPLGEPYDQDIPPDGIDDYPHGWKGTYDGGQAVGVKPDWYTQKQNATAYANYTNHKSWDLVTITIDNTNQAPHGWPWLANGNLRSLCDEPHFIDFAVRHFRTGIDDTFEAPTPVFDDSADVDLWENRRDYIEFFVQGGDDEGIALVEVYLYHEERVAAYEKATREEFACQIDDVRETYRFALGRLPDPDDVDFLPGSPADPGKKDDYRGQLYRGQTLRTTERIENWTGRMPVSTPELVEGEYRACARAFDKHGASVIANPDAVELSVSESLQKGQSPPCMSILSAEVPRAINPPVPESLPAKTPIKKFQCTYPAASPTECNTFPEQVLGEGNIVRLDIGVIPWSLPGEPDYNPNTEFLIEKVVMQNELDTPSGPMLGPENVLKAPYIINLDTLAPETSRIYVRTYDRVGGMSEMCVKITPDAHDPRVLARAPEDVYWGIKSTFTYYLQDKVPATSLQRITGFDLAGETSSMSSSNDHVTTNRTGDGIVLPPLAAFPHYDVTGDGVVDAVIDIAAVDDPSRLTDASKRKYSHVWDYQNQSLVPLQSGRCDQGRTTDYWIESDDDRGCGEEEMQILGADVGNKPDGLAPTPAQQLPGATLPEDLELVLFLANSRTSILEHHVTPSGAQPLGTYAWHTVITDDAQNTMFLKGGIDLSRYHTDLVIEELQLKDPLMGRLPGDPVNLTGVVRHVEGFESVDLFLYYTWDSDPWQDLDGALLEQAVRHEEMVAAGTILVRQCALGPFVLPCPVKLGETGDVHLNRTFGPGQHEVTLRVHPHPLVIEEQQEDNVMTATFEVYLGRTDTATGSYYIRAGDRGMPRLTDGVIDLETNETYDLRLGEFTAEADFEKGARSVYLFEVDGNTYYWDPTERRVASDTETTCHLPGDAFVPTCRPITVVAEPYVAPESVDSPGIALLALVGSLMCALAVARRRR